MLTPKIGLSPVVIDVINKTSPSLDELVFGSTVIMLLNYLVMKYLLKREVPFWKHFVIMLCSDCAFLINNFVKIYARNIYGPAIGIYGIAFFVIYYLLMFRVKGEKLFNINLLLGLMMGLFYTFGVIAFEGIWRVGFWSQDLSLLVSRMDQLPFLKNLIYTLIIAVCAWAVNTFANKNKKVKKN